MQSIDQSLGQTKLENIGWTFHGFGSEAKFIMSSTNTLELQGGRLLKGRAEGAGEQTEADANRLCKETGRCKKRCPVERGRSLRLGEARGEGPGRRRGVKGEQKGSGRERLPPGPRRAK